MFISPVVPEIFGGWYQPPHPNMLVSCQKEQMLSTVNQMYKVMSCHQHLDTDQVVSLSDKYQWADFTTIWSALYWLSSQSLILWKNLTTLKSTLIEQFFHKKISVLGYRLVAKQTAWKMSKTAKIETLSLVFRVTRAPIITLLMFITRTG